MKSRTHWFVSPSDLWTTLSLIWMALSLLARLCYYIPEKLTGAALWVYLLIPGGANIWFFLSILLWGEKTLLPICLSVFGGVFYFMVKAFTFSHWWHTLLCCILYLAVLVLYALTVTGILPTKKLLYPLFGLPLAFHLFVEDVVNYLLPGAPFWSMLPEISVLTIMASLLCLSFAMKQN